jgi:hypothetical protein
VAVLPLHFDSSPMGASGNVAGAGFSMTNVYSGEVKRALPPSSPDNRSKSQTEYEVEVKISNGMDPPTIITPQCVVVDQFGGVGDFSTHSFRAATKDRNGDVHLNGAQVLVAFVNGNYLNGFILGALKNTTAQAPATMVGRFLKWVFNGVSVNINDDGELRVRMNGATKSDGTPDTNRDDTNQGPYLQLTKDGNIYFTDNNGQSITVNSREKAVQIRATETAQINAKRVQIGSQMSAENLVLGQQLIAAMNDLILNVFIKGAPNLGKCAVGPVVLDPSMILALTQWKLKWTTGLAGPPQILSAKAYTER